MHTLLVPCVPTHLSSTPAGNTYLGLQRWGDAVECFDKAIGLSRDYSFAAANKALAMFQLGQREEAIR
jgi:tetratricopeptide (TPR) repeat protein